MTRISLFGGTGYAGGHIARAAVAQGHQVVSYSRNAPAEPVEGVEYRLGSLTDPETVAQAVADSEVVVSAVAPRGPLAGALSGALAEVAEAARLSGVRLGVVGGAGSLHVSEGGPRLIDTPDFPAQFASEAREMTDVLEALQASESDLDWFFVSPAAEFGSYNPGEARGTYRVGGDVLLADAQGSSFISGEDFGLAIADEITTPGHRRARFTVAY